MLSRNVGKKLPLLGFKIFLINPEDGTDRLSRNVGKNLPLLGFKNLLD